MNPGVTIRLTDERVGPGGERRSDTFRADNGLLEYIAHLMGGMRAAYECADVPTFFQNNVAFTRAIHTLSRNQTLMRIVAGIEKQALRYRYLAHLQTREMLAMTLDGHGGVAEAILAGRRDLAKRRAGQLMRRSHGVIVRALAESAYAVPGDVGVNELEEA